VQLSKIYEIIEGANRKQREPNGSLLSMPLANSKHFSPFLRSIIIFLLSVKNQRSKEIFFNPERFFFEINSPLKTKLGQK
jgi:hypothetical protein